MCASARHLELRKLRVGFLGAGSIVEAILAGIINKELLSADQVLITNRSDDERLHKLATDYGVQTLRDKTQLIEQSDLLILAMKPKDAQEACLDLRGLVRPDQLVISVIAGVPTQAISEWLSVDCPIVRTMPNTSSAVGLSATGIAAGRFADEGHLALASCLFEAIGSVYAVPETELDIITGLSGSGPAYFYYFVEAMQGAGREAGLSSEMARELTIQTILGAAHMLRHTQEEPEILRRKVTSPGGTTQAGLEVLESFDVKHALTAAVLRAAERAKELGSQYR
ncbi:pyrroline-5-carboxylate reductase [Brevibacillus dissolubilis]|uniref:pyrroline-5-carboxylate reductase n=1 Tax=Brevibacillus dissolubilis TaxID=1844116 RepID=UPI001115C254|nr:pyrroline-5-carboxylate reductase [Brevibacillus dissolubilis]